jgi:hypothetical protein
MSTEELIPDRLAVAILRAAIHEGRAGELLDCLFAGGSCTVDAGRLVLATAEQLGRLNVVDITPGSAEVYDG